MYSDPNWFAFASDEDVLFLVDRDTIFGED